MTKHDVDPFTLSVMRGVFAVGPRTAGLKPVGRATVASGAAAR